MQTEVTIREPSPTEIGRAVHLFRNVQVRAEARLLVAVKSRPVERFVGVAAWWSEGRVGRMQLACQPGVDRSEVGRGLVRHATESARSAGLEALEHAELLSDDNEWLGVLESEGFERMRSERSFEVPYEEAWTRVIKLHERYRGQIPPTWRTEPIRQHQPETILAMIAPHRLMPPAEVCSHWRSNSETGFHAELSCILFDGDRPFGAFLLRRMSDLLYIDVQVVQEPNARLRSLADIFLLYHDAQRLAPGGAVQRIQFRSGYTEHRQTANLALRMGGRELSRRYVLGKKLT